MMVGGVIGFQGSQIDTSGNTSGGSRDQDPYTVLSQGLGTNAGQPCSRCGADPGSSKMTTKYNAIIKWIADGRLR